MEVVWILLNCGANVNLRNNTDETTIHSAAFWGYLEIVRLLVVKGATFDAK